MNGEFTPLFSAELGGEPVMVDPRVGHKKEQDGQLVFLVGVRRESWKKKFQLISLTDLQNIPMGWAALSRQYLQNFWVPLKEETGNAA